MGSSAMSPASSVRNNQHVISVAADFSPTPVGRQLSDGPKSGELFRRKILAPALRKFEQVSVVLDGVEGVGSSFLEEAFGGLIREDGFEIEVIRTKLSLVSEEEPILKEEIWSYIEDAEKIRLNERASN